MIEVPPLVVGKIIADSALRVFLCPMRSAEIRSKPFLPGKRTKNTCALFPALEHVVYRRIWHVAILFHFIRIFRQSAESLLSSEYGTQRRICNFFHKIKNLKMGFT
jgi:hypothetical protein